MLTNSREKSIVTIQPKGGNNPLEYYVHIGKDNNPSVWFYISLSNYPDKQPNELLLSRFVPNGSTLEDGLVQSGPEVPIEQLLVNLSDQEQVVYIKSMLDLLANLYLDDNRLDLELFVALYPILHGVKNLGDPTKIYRALIDSFYLGQDTQIED